MSAQVLREAAALMRSRARGARAGVWIATGDRIDATWSDGPRYVAESDVMGGSLNAQHIASWHPAVALAVADWLDATARELDALGNPDLGAHPLDGRRTAALAVATAYLGATS